MAKRPFVYTLAHQMLDVQSSAASIPNHGVTKITAQSTYTLASPYAGALKTFYRQPGLSTAGSVISAGSGVSFDSNGGASKITLQPSTAGTGSDISVTLIGESSTQWRVLSAWPRLAPDSTTSGVVLSS